jgi:hypothetical protein
MSFLSRKENAHVCPLCLHWNHTFPEVSLIEMESPENVNGRSLIMSVVRSVVMYACLSNTCSIALRCAVLLRQQRVPREEFQKTQQGFLKHGMFVLVVVMVVVVVLLLDVWK